MRLFVVFRTFDRIWTCMTYTRELAPFEMDMSNGPIKLMFMVDQVREADHGHKLFVMNSHLLRRLTSLPREVISFYCQAHEKFVPVIVKPLKDQPVVSSPIVSAKKGLLRRFSLPSMELNVKTAHANNADHFVHNLEDMIYFVLPMFRCTIVMDAHTASAVSNEYSRSRKFRRHFLRYIRRQQGFRNCVPDYETWTDEEKEAWDNYLSVPYMIDIVTVWPKQKLDYACCHRVLGLLNKHVVLEEGFAWLSTLGGAHSSLGETFSHHAERAGEISGQQLRLAIQLGNESLIARCYVFWSWSLLQRGQLKRCKTCILNTWKFCHHIKSRDMILENMCRAVWSRLKYKKSLLKKNKQKKTRRLDRDESDRDDASHDKGSSIIVVNSSNATSTSSSPSSKGDGSSPSCKGKTVRSPTTAVLNTVRVC